MVTRTSSTATVTAWLARDDSGSRALDCDLPDDTDRGLHDGADDGAKGGWLRGSVLTCLPNPGRVELAGARLGA